MRRYADETVWEELTYLAFHLHWSLDDLLDLPHRTRHRLIVLVGGHAERNERSSDG